LLAPGAVDSAMKDRLIFLGAGLCIVALLVGGFLYATRGSHIRLEGKIQKVRFLPADEKSSVVVVDFRFANPARYPFVVRTVQVFAEMKDGARLEGAVISDSDAKRLFDYYPDLGAKYNESLITREKIPPGAYLDRMISARFEAPEPQLADRKQIIVRIEDVDGASTQLMEEAR
jgi:hypothetical protein